MDMPKAKRVKKEVEVAKDTPPLIADTNFIALIQEIKSLASPLTSIEKLLPAAGTKVREFHWPRITSAIDESRRIWRDNREAITDKLEDAFRIAQELHTQQLSTLEHRFRQEVEKHGWSLQGSWPEPVVEQVVFVKIVPEAGKIFINDRVIPWCPIEELVVEIDKERSELCPSSFSPLAWLSEVCRAYDKVVANLELSKGEPVPVFDVLAQIVWGRQDKKFFSDPSRENFKDYSVKEFRANLTHALASGITTTDDGRRLDISAGSFSRQTIFMYFPSTRHLGSCGRIAFNQSTSR